ncbi:MAG: hypothetical protein HYW57_09705 [Ignavibacteriales bacterium]|nr:hypothetical protein [Ignavibacteriales bacterium]
MLEGTRRGVGLLYTRFRFRKISDPVIRFTEAVSHARRALVLLPEATKDISSVQWIIRSLAERFAEGTMTVVARSDQATWVKKEQLRFQILVYDRKEVSPWYIPRSELLGKMKRSTFDVAFDLNPEFALTSAFLCRESKAPLRVGFKKLHADEFYNFQVNTKSTNSLAVAYRNLARCLEMF